MGMGHIEYADESEKVKSRHKNDPSYHREYYLQNRELILERAKIIYNKKRGKVCLEKMT